MHRSMLLALVVAATGCASRLPSTRPVDFSIERTTGGGMRPVSSTFRCERTACTTTARVNAAEAEIHYVASDADLDALYRVLRAQRFDRIDVREEGEVHDRGGTTVRVTADEGTFEVRNAGNTFVTDVEEWNAVEAAIDALEARLAASSAVDVTIVLSGALATAATTVGFDGDDDGARSATTSTSDPAERRVRLAPGTHIVVVRTPTARGVGTIEVGATRSFRIDLRGDALVVD